MNANNRMTRRGLIMAILFACTIAGRMLIGSTIGAASDAEKPKEITIPGWKVDTLKVGVKIEVVQRDGTILNGYYNGLEAMSPEEYARVYAESLNRLPPDLHFSSLYEEVQFTFAAPKLGGPEVVLESRFQGFAPNAILFAALGPGNAATQKKSFYELLRLRTHAGAVIEAKTICAVVRDGLVPVQLRLNIFDPTSQQKRLLSIDEIQQLHQSGTPRKGALTGFLVGAMIDFTVVVIWWSTPIVSFGDE